MDSYIETEQLGEGKYGKVFKGRKCSTLQPVAIKKVTFEQNAIPSSYTREISILKELQHDNIVSLEDVVVDGNRMYLIYEYLRMDLGSYLHCHESHGMPLDAIRSYLYQITQALLFCHQRRVLHCDLRPENLLIDGSGVIKIGDFGLVREMNVPTNRKYTPSLISLWYTSSELLLRTKNYAGHLDIWSFGTIFAEMSTGEPLFDGDSEVDQLVRIFSVLSTPSESIPPYHRLSRYHIDFSKYDENRLGSKVSLDGTAFELLEEMLECNFPKRISAAQILNHDFFVDFDKALILPKFANDNSSSSGSNSSSGSLPE